MKRKAHTSTDRRGHPIDLRPIETLLSRIDDTYHPRQVWLFGSRARGEARPQSDWDLFVVVPDTTDDSEFDPMIAWQITKDLKGVYADVIPCRISEFSDWRDTVCTLAYSVNKEGILLYESEN